jgi:hypothetical protein
VIREGSLVGQLSDQTHPQPDLDGVMLHVSGDVAHSFPAWSFNSGRVAVSVVVITSSYVDRCHVV